MSYENLKEAVLAVEENNSINDSKWSNWESADDVISTYEIEKLTKKESAVIQRAINSNGKTLPTDLRAAEFEELAGAPFGGGGYWIEIIEQRYA